MSVLLFVLMASMQQAPATAPAPTTAATPAAAPAPRRTAPAPAATASVQVRVTDRSGKPANGVRVSAEGPSSRDGETDARGLVTLQTVTPGAYRMRASGDGFITLEKEVAVKAGGTTPPVEFALSAAPPPPPAPEPPPPPAPEPPPAPVATPNIMPGQPRVLSLLDLAEKSLGGRDAVRHVPIGCSGQGNAELLVVRDSAQFPARADADSTLYVVAGEVTLQLAGKEQDLAPGWFSIVPRGSSHSVSRKGKNPAILLLIASGPACAPQSASR
jgi:mannose-6-phosphate isomerase-like protein (cupin superfamily)